jgi:hypothetical protein
MSNSDKKALLFGYAQKDKKKAQTLGFALS